MAFCSQCNLYMYTLHEMRQKPHVLPSFFSIAFRLCVCVHILMFRTTRHEKGERNHGDGRSQLRHGIHRGRGLRGVETCRRQGAAVVRQGMCLMRYLSLPAAADTAVGEKFESRCCIACTASPCIAKLTCVRASMCPSVVLRAMFLVTVVLRTFSRPSPGCLVVLGGVETMMLCERKVTVHDNFLCNTRTHFVRSLAHRPWPSGSQVPA